VALHPPLVNPPLVTECKCLWLLRPWVWQVVEPMFPNLGGISWQSDETKAPVSASTPLGDSGHRYMARPGGSSDLGCRWVEAPRHAHFAV
jgi:hypothetical protein